MNEAKQALADCPMYHRIPLHFRNTASGNTLSPPVGPDVAEIVDLDLSIHAPEGQQEATLSQRPQQVLIDLEPEPTESGTPLGELIKPIKPRRGPGRPKGSENQAQGPSTTASGANQHYNIDKSAIDEVPGGLLGGHARAHHFEKAPRGRAGGHYG